MAVLLTVCRTFNTSGGLRWTINVRVGFLEKILLVLYTSAAD
jgi:hypothetical protein